MRILLVNMPIKFNRKENMEPPLGISYLAGVLEQCGYEVFLKDYEVEFFRSRDIVEFIKNNKINVVGISFRTASFRSAKIFSETLKPLRSKIVLIAGGHHATAFPVSTVSDLSCDIVVRGEGEYTLREIVQSLEGGRSLSGVRGITYVIKGRIMSNKERELISDLDKLPFPSYQKLPYNLYTVATIITSRGCPFSCIYCDKGVSTKKVRYRSKDNILKEIRYITEITKKNRIYIVDDHFFLRKQRALDVLNSLIVSGLKIKWICQARADAVDEQLLIKAKKSGCEQIMYGLETGDERELSYIKKETTLEQARNAVALTKKNGIKARVNFMIGFPISTHESIRNTLRFAREIAPDVIRFFAVTPLPNTELWENIYGKSISIHNISWENFDFYNPSFETEVFTREDISLYILAGYWHVLKKRFILESTIFLLPNIVRLFSSLIKTGRIRGNISLYFPATVNLLRDVFSQLRGKNFIDIINLIVKAFVLEKNII